MPYERGFLLGKFMPPHQGHVFLCNVAAAMVQQLTVLVCTRDCEPIDGATRFQWVTDLVARNAKVRHLHRDLPQEPGEHPDFWPIWRDTIKSIHPAGIDVVFGSEDYVHRLAAELNAEPVIVDHRREIIPVSAHMIRQSPDENWIYIPGVVRPYYQQRICALGPESTGKSTLCAELARVYETRFVPEYGRTFDELFRVGKNWSPDDFSSIAEAHIALRREISRLANFICLEDTDLLQTVVWAEYLLGEVPDQLRAMLDEFEPAQLYLLLEPDVAWLDDGSRYSGSSDVRYWFLERLTSLLETKKLPYRRIRGTEWKARTLTAQTAIGDFTPASRRWLNQTASPTS